MGENYNDDISHNLIQNMQNLDPSVDYSKLDVEPVVQKLRQHHRRMMSIFANMYADVAYELTDTPMNVAFLRSKPYFDQLEKTMADLVAWGKPVKSFVGGKSSSGGGGGGFAAFKQKK